MARGPRIGARALFFNALLPTALCAALAGCGDDPPPVAEKPSASSARRQPDATVPDLPRSPLDVFSSLPRPPTPGLAAPGDSWTMVSGPESPAHALSMTPVIRQQPTPPDSAFREITYLADAADAADPPPRVKAVLYSLAPAYGHPIHWQLAVSAIVSQLGPGQSFREAPYGGVRWTVENYRIDLRRDEVTRDVELMLHRRGGRTLELPAAGDPPPVDTRR